MFPAKRAFLIATGLHQNMGSLLHMRPSPLLHIADKPVLFHIIENLTQRGFKKIDLVLHHFPEQIEEMVGEGKRWGIEVQYHLAKNPDCPLAAIAPCYHRLRDEWILLGLGDAIPKLPSEPHAGDNPCLFHYPEGHWSGWGIIPLSALSALPKNIRLQEIPDRLPLKTIHKVQEFLAVDSLEKLKNSNQIFLKEEIAGFIFPTTAKKVEPGVWISRAVVLEPGVEVFPPVFIGEHTHIKAGARIGPGAIIENHCFVDSGSSIVNSLICQNSYIGESLEINDCIVDRNGLMNLTLGTAITVSEDFILSDTAAPALSSPFISMLERFCALCLFTVLLPLYWSLRACCPLKYEEMLKLPASVDPNEWTTYRLATFDAPPASFKNRFCRLPWLLQVIKGCLHFAGVPPRTRYQTANLPLEWQRLYLKAKAGIIALHDVESQASPGYDEMYAAESFYFVHHSVWLDLKICLKWLLRKFGL